MSENEVRKMASQWCVQVCPECNGLVGERSQAHNETCPNRHGTPFVPKSIEVVPLASQPVVERQGSSRYLEFVREQPPGRKTPVVIVKSKSGGMTLGTIAWFGRWRQFCFYPDARTIFNVGCMTDIQAKIAELQEERRQSSSNP